MPVKIRLMRIGTNKRPFYRVVAVDERKKRTGGYLELLGTYNPLTEPKEINLDQGKIDAWVKKGAQPSHGFLRIIGKAPQKPPRKPKKEPKTPPAAAPAAEAPAKEEAPVTSEESIKEAPMPEAASEAAEVLETAPEAKEEAPVEASSDSSETPPSDQADNTDSADVSEEKKSDS